MGLAWSFISENFPLESPAWSVNDIPDLTGKTVIITGGNTGLGKETAKALLQHNATVYILSRSKDKAIKAINELKLETGHEAHFIELDLANLKSVKAAATEFLRREKQLHILFNNGGVMTPPIDQLTVDGYDLQFGTNVIGHFYLTQLLLPILLSTAKSVPEKQVRVINLTSWAHRVGELDFNTFKDTPARRKKGTGNLYGQSKFGNAVFTNELARRYGNEGMISISVHPGSIASDLQRHMSLFMRYVVVPLLTYPIEKGALTQLRAGTAPEAGEWNGKYASPWARLRPIDKRSEDPILGKQLWEYMEEQVKDI